MPDIEPRPSASSEVRRAEADLAARLAAVLEITISNQSSMATTMKEIRTILASLPEAVREEFIKVLERFVADLAGQVASKVVDSMLLQIIKDQQKTMQSATKRKTTSTSGPSQGAIDGFFAAKAGLLKAIASFLAAISIALGSWLARGWSDAPAAPPPRPPTETAP